MKIFRKPRVVFDPPNPSGLCMCNCGEKTEIAKYTSRREKCMIGFPRRFVQGHNGRISIRLGIEYLIVDCGYKTPCWIWQLYKDGNGYGRRNHRGHPWPAHKLSYFNHHGEIPPGFHLDHLCRVHSCINPDHLEPVTIGENVRRGAMAKLTHNNIPIIKQLREEGLTYEAIGKQFNVEKSTIRKVITGKTWADQSGPPKQPAQVMTRLLPG